MANNFNINSDFTKFEKFFLEENSKLNLISKNDEKLLYEKHIYDSLAIKLTGKLKEEVIKAENKEEAKKLIAQAGMELTDEEMDQVSGGDIKFKYNRPGEII